MNMAKKKMAIVDSILQILTDIEGFANAKTESVLASVKLIAMVAVVLALVASTEMFGSGQPLTGLPLTSIKNGFAPPVAAVIAFIAVVLGSVVFLLVASAALHVFALLLGAKKGFADTVPAMVAFMAPNLLLGWIPIVNIWTSIYTFLIIVYVLAIKQDLTMAKATLAIAIPIIIVTVIAAASGGMRAGGMVQTLVPIG